MIMNLLNCGYTLQDARRTTYADYELIMIAKWHKDEEKLALHRDLLATIMNFGGMGIDKPISGRDLIPLTLIDNIYSDEVNTMTKAKELLKYIASN